MSSKKRYEVYVTCFEEEKEMSDLTRKQQRELGILPRQILSTIRQLKEDGQVVAGMTSREIAFVVMADVMQVSEYSETWGAVRQGTYGVDWEAIADFIERIVELLMIILPLFI